MQKKQLLLAGLTLMVGVMIGDFVGRYRTAKLRALGELYPSEVGQRIQLNVKVLDLLGSNESEIAKALLRQDIEICLSSLSDLKFVLPIKTQDEALRIGSEFLARSPNE